MSGEILAADLERLRRSAVQYGTLVYRAALKEGDVESAARVLVEMAALGLKPEGGPSASDQNPPQPKAQ
jgi:hypothetical protein